MEGNNLKLLELDDKHIQSLFKTLDKDKNGFLSVDEIKKGLKEAFPNIIDKSSDVISAAFFTVDDSNDMQLSLNEFKTFMKVFKKLNEIISGLKSADENNDKNISLDEWREFAENNRPLLKAAQIKLSDDELFKYIAPEGKASYAKLAIFLVQNALKASKQSTKSPSNAPVDLKSLKPGQKFSEAEITELFERFDANNNNGYLSLAEIDKAVIDIWPEISSHKDAIRRAYKTSDTSNDGFITQKEFSELLLYLDYYVQINAKFKVLDVNHDKRINFDEFRKGFQLLGLDKKFSQEELEYEFDKMDVNGGGYVLFDELCHYMAQHFGRPGKSKKTDLIDPESSKSVAAKQGKHNKFDPSTNEQAKQIMKMKATVQGGIEQKFTDEQIHDLFLRFDVNNSNGYLSLAEIDKAVIDLWPEIAKYKDAISRAYHTSDLSNDGFVTEPEFKDLLLYLGYYVKLNKVFANMDVDSDKRLDFQEFERGHKLMGIEKSGEELQREFESIDDNGGGKILFDEFCHYMSSKYGRPGKSQKTDLIKKQQPQQQQQKRSIKSPQPAQQQQQSGKTEKSASDSKQYGSLEVNREWNEEELEKLFKRFDVSNNNGYLSLAEIEKAMLDLWPQLFHQHRDALRRAYFTADISNDGFITKKEFEDLLNYLAFYVKIHEKFKVLDVNRDKRVSFEEFNKGFHIMGLNNYSANQIQQEFERIDVNGGGFVLFDELCHYMAQLLGRPGKNQKPVSIAAGGKSKTNAAPVSRVQPQKSQQPKQQPHNMNDEQYDSYQPQTANTVSAGQHRESLVSTGGVSVNRRSSIERQYVKEKMERKHLELQVESLRHQLAQLSPSNDNASREYLSNWQAMSEKNYQLSLKLEKERERNNDLQATILQLTEQLHEIEQNQHKEFMGEAKRVKQNQAVTLSHEVRELKSERAKFERLYNDMCRKLTIEEERNRRLADELSEVRRQSTAMARVQATAKSEKKYGF